MDYALLKDAPDDIVRKLKDYGIKASKPEIISRGGGFARTGKVRVHWRHKSEEA